MSLSNNSNKIEGGGKSWEKFDMEDFDSPSLPKQKDNTDFTEFASFQIGGDSAAGFVPLMESRDSQGIKEEAEGVLKKAQETAMLMEREGYEKGFAQGEKDGIELGEKKAKKITENIENILIEISHLKIRIVKQYEKEILELFFAIAKKVINRQISSDESAVKGTVIKAINLATEKSKIVLRVNPEDFEYIERLRPEFFAEFEELKSITATSDPSITRGGCFLETAYGDVDARVETQLERIYQSLEVSFNDK